MDVETKIRLIKGLFIQLFRPSSPMRLTPIDVKLNGEVIATFKPTCFSLRILEGEVEGNKIGIAAVSEMEKGSILSHWRHLGFKCAWIIKNRVRVSFVIENPRTREILIFTGQDAVREARSILGDQINERRSQMWDAF